ncbi:MAG: hypothetical protein VYA34_07520, partial [Myxococcota bacterium]|nr:hypothetical protein [Myxococcota bacterium]
ITLSALTNQITKIHAIEVGELCPIVLETITLLRKKGNRVRPPHRAYKPVRLNPSFTLKYTSSISILPVAVTNIAPRQTRSDGHLDAPAAPQIYLVFPSTETKFLQQVG